MPRRTRTFRRLLLHASAAAAVLLLAPAGSASVQEPGGKSEIRVHGRTFDSAYELRRFLDRRDVDFDRYLRASPQVARAFDLRPVRWGNRDIYTKYAMSRWLNARSLSFATWKRRNASAAATLQHNASVSLRPTKKPLEPGKPSKPGDPPPPPSTPPPPPPPPPAAVTVSSFGIAAGGNMHNLSADELGREMDTYRASGSSWVRIDLNWSLIQRGGPESYEWEPFDRVVRAARDRGLNVLAGMLYTPGWARPGTSDSRYPPFDLSTYARFSRAAVEHYAPLGVKHWEVWNEPNIGFWMPEPDPARYTALLKLAYAQIKSADPSAFVISAGLAPYGAYGQQASGLMNPLTFLERMYAAGAKGSFDAVGFHPYNFGGLFFHPSSAWSQVADTPLSVRSMMVANGDGDKQVWGTEFGAPTGSGPGAIAEDAQAQMLTEGFNRWRERSWSGPLFWYSLRDAGTNPADREHNFGLVRRDFSAKPSLAAYAAVAAR